MANNWTFLWWILKELFFFSKSSNEVMLLLQTIFTDRSCKWFSFTFYLPAMKHPDEWTICKLDSRNMFIRIRFCLKFINLDNLANTASFLPAFLQREITWSSKLRFLPISIPSSFCHAFSRIFSSPILTQSFSCLCPKSKPWHLPLLSFMLLVSNHSIAKKALC